MRSFFNSWIFLRIRAQNVKDIKVSIRTFEIRGTRIIASIFMKLLCMKKLTTRATPGRSIVI